MYNLTNKDRKREIILQGSGKKKTYMQANNPGKLPIVRLRYVHNKVILFPLGKQQF